MRKVIDTTIGRMGHEESDQRQRKTSGVAPLQSYGPWRDLPWRRASWHQHWLCREPAAASPSRVVPEQPSKGTRDPACAGKWSHRMGQEYQRETQKQSLGFLAENGMSYSTDVFSQCSLSLYGWDFGKEGF